MPYYDLNETDIEDLPEHLQPDPHCVWVWVVHRTGTEGGGPISVHFDRDSAEWAADAKGEHGDVAVKRTRMWFTDDDSERRVWRVPGSGYRE